MIPVWWAGGSARDGPVQVFHAQARPFGGVGPSIKFGADPAGETDVLHRLQDRSGGHVPPVDGGEGEGLAAGTAAGALTDAGLYDPANPSPLHDKDVWYLRSLAGETPGSAILRFEGLATIADIFVNGALRHASVSMFEPFDLSLDLSGDDELAICFRALAPHLDKRGPRARWRPQMMEIGMAGARR